MFLAKKKVPLTDSIKVALKSIFGLGRARYNGICMKLGISPKANLIDLNSAKRRGLTNLVDQFCTDKMLKRELMLVLTGITRHGCYKGIRLKQGLPANGQRTRSNAMTARRRLAFSSISNLGKA